MKGKIIPQDRSIVISCRTLDNLNKFKHVIETTEKIEGVGGYIIDPSLVLRFGFSKVLDLAKSSNKPIIYDHQRAGVGTVAFAQDFAEICNIEGIDAVILSPQIGTYTQAAFIESAKVVGLEIICDNK